ncbi:hypothetical protein E5Z02_33560, partial [Streptomyces rhizosphaericola]
DICGALGHTDGPVNFDFVVDRTEAIRAAGSARAASPPLWTTSPAVAAVRISSAAEGEGAAAAASAQSAPFSQAFSSRARPSARLSSASA